MHPHVCVAHRARGGPDDIGLTPIGVELDGSGQRTAPLGRPAAPRTRSGSSTACPPGPSPPPWQTGRAHTRRGVHTRGPSPRSAPPSCTRPARTLSRSGTRCRRCPCRDLEKGAAQQSEGGQPDFVWPPARTMHPHVGPQHVWRAWPPNEIKKNTRPKNITALFSGRRRTGPLCRSRTWRRPGRWLGWLPAPCSGRSRRPTHTKKSG